LQFFKTDIDDIAKSSGGEAFENYEFVDAVKEFGGIWMGLNQGLGRQSGGLTVPRYDIHNSVSDTRRDIPVRIFVISM